MPADANVLVTANRIDHCCTLVFKDVWLRPVTQISKRAESSFDLASLVWLSAGLYPVREFPHMMAWIKAVPEKANSLRACDRQLAALFCAHGEQSHQHHFLL
ncbi:MAG: hypothetical protein IPN04_09775 [Rhodoferax sp.]|nr:hypothetical protein [Rhodoferax sp.]